MTERGRPRRGRDAGSADKRAKNAGSAKSAGSATKAVASKGSANTSSAKKSSVKKSSAQKSSAKKSAATRGTGQAGARHAGARHAGAARPPAPKKAALKKAAPKKAAAKKSSAKKTAPTKGSGAKSIAARASEERAARRRDQGAPSRHATTVRPAPRRRTPSAAAAPAHDPSGVRLQRVLAAAGMGSRRACEALIDEGRVEVDGVVVVDQGLRVDPAKAVIHVDGLRVASAPGHVYLLLNKPVGVVSTMSDPEGRLTVADYLGGRDARLFHVGRLDADTEGLILLTNDGDLAHRLSHPSFGVRKTYLAEITGPVARDVGKRLKAGVELEDGPAKVDSFRLVSTVGSRVMVELSLHEGRKHIVRRMLAEVGHPVTRLVRTDLGPISLGNLRPGKQRKLSQQEVGALYRAVGL